MGSYGYPRPTTPSIDRVAREAVLFEDCIAQASETLASHASMLTSTLPPHHGASTARQSRLAGHLSSLAEVLRGHGYRTASFNGGIQLARAYGLDRGFDRYESIQAKSSAAEVLAGPQNRLAENVSRGIAWIEESEQPFFLFLHSYEVHHPYTPDPEHLRIFRHDYAGPLPDAISVQLLQAINAGRLSATAADRQHVVDTYDAEIRSADEAFGALVSFLKERGLYEDTLLVVTSDHGEEFGEHGMMGWHSHTLYDELIRVPLVIKWPGAHLTGIRVAAQVRSIDVAPTVLAALGLEKPRSFMGRDLAALVSGDHGRDLPAVSVLDTVQSRPFRSVRVGDWKLHGRKLFDLREDPAERRNVIRSRPERGRELAAIALRQLHSRRVAGVTPARVADETLDRLRALGYAE